MVPVQLIPGTLNVGHTLSTIAQAFIYTKIVPVDSITLILMIAAACVGAWLGRRRRRALAAPQDSDRHGDRTARRGGADADDAAQYRARRRRRLGLSRDAARARSRRQLRPRRADDARHRPVRAVHDPGQPARHESDRGVSDHDGIVRVPDADQQRALRATAHLHVRAALGLAIGGLPAVLIAAYLVQSLSLDAVRWLVIVVVVYTSVNMLMTAGRTRRGRTAGWQERMRKPVVLDHRRRRRNRPRSGHAPRRRRLADHHARRQPARCVAGAARDPRVHRIDHRHEPARSHPRGVRGRPRLSPRGAAVDARRVHAGHGASRQRRRHAQPARVRAAAGRIARPPGRLRLSVVDRRLRPAEPRDEDARRHACARTSTRIRRRCTGATSCIASSWAATTRGTTSSCRPTPTRASTSAACAFPD